MTRILKTLLAAALGAACISTAAYAADEAKAPTPQQMRMKACNQEAGGKQLKGEPRKEFMRGCLSGKKGEGKGPAMAASDHPECAARANDSKGKPLAGAARASFMKKCMNEMPMANKP
ncbi:MAG TPA: PsiF family protein [Rhodocyclaceae bacterium]